MNTVSITDVIRNVPPGEWLIVVQATNTAGEVLSENKAKISIPAPAVDAMVVEVPVVTVA